MSAPVDIVAAREALTFLVDRKPLLAEPKLVYAALNELEELRVELAKLDDLRAQLAAAQAELKDAEQAGADWRDERDDARDELAAAQARVKELGEWQCELCESSLADIENYDGGDLRGRGCTGYWVCGGCYNAKLQAATERADKAERERDEARERVGFFSETDLIDTLTRERDAAIREKTEALFHVESKWSAMWGEKIAELEEMREECGVALLERDEHKEKRDDYSKALLDVREERDAERKEVLRLDALWVEARAEVVAERTAKEEARSELAELLRTDHVLSRLKSERDAERKRADDNAEAARVERRAALRAEQERKEALATWSAAEAAARELRKQLRQQCDCRAGEPSRPHEPECATLVAHSKVKP